MKKTNQKLSKSRPISVRLTPEERALLEARAKGASLSRFIREKLFANACTSDDEARLSPEHRQKLLAQILAKLGSMNAGQNLQELTELARVGAIELAPETEELFDGTLKEFQGLRRDLLVALGLRPKKGDAP